VQAGLKLLLNFLCRSVPILWDLKNQVPEHGTQWSRTCLLMITSYIA